MWFARPRHEPAYEGRPLSQWIAQIKMGSSNRMAHLGPVKAEREAIKAMGLAALPALLESVRPPGYETWWQAAYREHYPDLPSALSVRLTPPPIPNQIRDHAFNSFVVSSCRSLRPLANPLLVKSLRHSRPEVRATAAQALAWRTNTASPEILAALTDCLRDPDAEVRRYVVAAISFFGPAASEAVPAIVENMRSPRPAKNSALAEDELVSAAMTLGKIGPSAIAAVPVLREGAGQRTNALFRVVSAIALWRIRHDPSDALPVLLAEVGSFDRGMKWMILECFGEMGTGAAAAIPSLAALVTPPPDANDDDGFVSYNRKLALEALQKIALDVAKKLAGEAAEPPQ